MSAEDMVRDAARRVAAAGESSPRYARDPVNMPAIRNWTDAIGDRNPLYTDPEFAARSVHGQPVAPPAMIQVWTMPGLAPPATPTGSNNSESNNSIAESSEPDDGGPGAVDPLGEMMTVLDEAGFTSVVATNCDQTYLRYLRHGEVLGLRAALVDVTGPKQTALGEGWFVTTRNTWYSGDEPVATMDWRVLKFRPPATDAIGDEPILGSSRGSGPAMRPPHSPDTEFFWAGTAIGELRIQQCGVCGALRHPPGPACLDCGATEKQDYQVAAGTGTVYSYVVHRHPPVPGKQLPIVIALVELTEGVRMLGELHGVSPEQVSIGLPVRTEFTRIDDELMLPGWREDTRGRPGALPELALDVTPTLIVSAAIATRDFYPVHHDRDFAVRGGNEDIFLNILTTTGLVQRYVTDWAGPEAIVRSISVRLGAPCYAGDTLTFSGQVTETAGDVQIVAVTGACGLGNHVTGTVRLTTAASEP
jgi:uncharacterized protein